jgi:hypothetical protein
MKLIYCPECSDLVTLTPDTVKRECRSKCSWGHYLQDDNINAVYGGKAVPIGINSHNLDSAIECQLDDVPLHFSAYIVPKNCETFKREES